MVTTDHVSLAYNEMSDSNIVKVMKTLKKFEVLALVTLFIENSKIEKVEIGKLQNSCEILLREL